MSQVPQLETCYQHEGFVDMCIFGLRASVGAGLEEVLNRHFAKTPGAPEYEVGRVVSGSPKLAATETAPAVTMVGAGSAAPTTGGSYLDRCPRLEGESSLARARRCKAASLQAAESP